MTTKQPKAATQALVDFVVERLEERKAIDIKVMDVRDLTDVTDFMVVATGNSVRQVRAIAEHLALSAKQGGEAALNVEGADTAEWILVDFVDVVVHIMLPSARELYNLEELWSD